MFQFPCNHHFWLFNESMRFDDTQGCGGQRSTLIFTFSRQALLMGDTKKKSTTVSEKHKNQVVNTDVRTWPVLFIFDVARATYF